MTPFASRLDAGIVAMCAAAFALAAVLAAPAVLDGSDLYWHIAAGRWMIDNQAVLRIDPFSSTFAGHPWQTQDWLAEVALALAYVGAGWSGVLALGAAVTALAAGMLGWFLSRRGPLLIVLLLLSLAVAAGTIAATPFVLALPLAVIWIAALVNARVRHRAPSFKLLVVMVLWANLNAGFLAGLVLLAVLGAEAVVEERSVRAAAARDWGIFAGLSLIAAAITPYGVEGFAHAVRHVGLPTYGAIRTVSPLLLALPAAAVMLQHGSALKPFRVAALAVLFAGALYASEWRLLFCAAAPLLLADPFAAALAQKGLRSAMAVRSSAAFAALCALALVLRLALPVVRGDGPNAPGAALAMVPHALARSAVLNDPTFGGYLIFHDVRPFIDDRALYSRNFRDRYRRMVRPDPALLKAALAHYRIRWTIFAPNDPVVVAMEALETWPRLYADRWAVVHVRNDAS